MSVYYDKALSKLMTKYCCFFAFNNEQYEAAANVNFKYAAGGAGLCVPVDFTRKVIDGIHEIHVKDVAIKRATKTNKQIIWDAFSNFESHISGELYDVYDSLAGYPGITKAMIDTEYKEFFDHCCEHDLF